jgi:hypothetical protein
MDENDQRDYKKLSEGIRRFYVALLALGLRGIGWRPVIKRLAEKTDLDPKTITDIFDEVDQAGRPTRPRRIRRFLTRCYRKLLRKAS